MERLVKGEQTVRWSISLPTSLLDAVRKQSGGNMSHWIRKCITDRLYGGGGRPRTPPDEM